MTTNNMFKVGLALEIAGYQVEAHERAADVLVQCFLDYADAGVFRGMDADEASELIEDGDITISEMAQAIIQYGRAC